MSRIQTLFETLKQQNKTALIPFITAGDPHADISVELLHGLVEGGANIIELGVPFSDPMADGPVIQRASERALAHNISLTDVLNIVREFRETNNEVPIVLMGYLNPIEIMGYENFVNNARAAGVDGVLIVDLPPEETEGFSELLQKNEIDQVFLIAPTTYGDRLQSICDNASGFVYYVSLKGVTGSSSLDVEEVGQKLNEIRQKTSLPIGVGFGIKDAESASSVAAISDAVVVGSALVEHLYQNAEPKGQLRNVAKEFLLGLRTAIDSV